MLKTKIIFPPPYIQTFFTALYRLTLTFHKNMSILFKGENKSVLFLVTCLILFSMLDLIIKLESDMTTQIEIKIAEIFPYLLFSYDLYPIF